MSPFMVKCLAICDENISYLGNPGPCTKRYITTHTDDAGIVQCSAVQCSAVQCISVQCSAVQCSPLQCSAMHFSAVQCSAVHCSAVQCRAGQCSAVQWRAAHCCLVLHCKPLHYTGQKSSNLWQDWQCPGIISSVAWISGWGWENTLFSNTITGIAMTVSEFGIIQWCIYVYRTVHVHCNIAKNICQIYLECRFERQN